MARRIQLHTMNRERSGIAIAISAFLLLAAATNSFTKTGASQTGIAQRSLTPLQLEIQKQQQRLASSEVEERRDALMRLGSLRHPDASRVAVSGLSDALPIVRATAVHAARTQARCAVAVGVGHGRLPSEPSAGHTISRRGSVRS